MVRSLYVILFFVITLTFKSDSHEVHREGDCNFKWGNSKKNVFIESLKNVVLHIEHVVESTDKNLCKDNIENTVNEVTNILYSIAHPLFCKKTS